LHYQPIVRLSDRRLMGYEALARWGKRSPPIIAKTVEAHALELTWIRQQLADIDLVLTTLPPPLWVSLNLSQRVLAIESLPALLQTTPHTLRIHLEVLESVRITDAAANALQELGAYHIIKADDVGSLDHSFLDRLVGKYSYLFHGLKLCKGLTKNILTDRRTATFCELFLRVAVECGLETTAEWVESEPQAQQLADWGCGFGQGELFGMPGPLD
jgi:EAL domain-containing protein (putative c-di-GMP-specific phosphodiesterase class I)